MATEIGEIVVIVRCASRTTVVNVAQLPDAGGDLQMDTLCRPLHAGERLVALKCPTCPRDHALLVVVAAVASCVAGSYGCVTLTQDEVDRELDSWSGF